MSVRFRTCQLVHIFLKNLKEDAVIDGILAESLEKAMLQSLEVINTNFTNVLINLFCKNRMKSQIFEYKL